MDMESGLVRYNYYQGVSREKADCRYGLLYLPRTLVVSTQVFRIDAIAAPENEFPLGCDQRPSPSPSPTHHNASATDIQWLTGPVQLIVTTNW